MRKCITVLACLCLMIMFSGCAMFGKGDVGSKISSIDDGQYGDTEIRAKNGYGVIVPVSKSNLTATVGQLIKLKDDAIVIEDAPPAPTEIKLGE